MTLAQESTLSSQISELLRSEGVPELCDTCKTARWTVFATEIDGLESVRCQCCGETWTRGSTKDALHTAVDRLSMLLYGVRPPEQISAAYNAVVNTWYIYQGDPSGRVMYVSTFGRGGHPSDDEIPF